MTELVTVGEKGQIVIPKKMRDDLKIEKGTKLLIIEDKDKITIKPVKLDEKHLFMLLSESSLAKDWLTEEEDKAWKHL